MKNEMLKFEELEVMEEMMSEFEKGFWDGITYVAAGTVIVGILT